MNPGSYFIIAAADYANAQSESSEADNFCSAPITLTLPPLPDLAVASVSAPANALPGQPIELVWVVTNRGAATAAGTWYENVFVTNTASGQQSLTMLVFSNSLPAGGFLLRTQAVSLAFNGPAGALWFQVGVDSRNDIVEQNEGQNLGTATNSTAVHSGAHLPSGGHANRRRRGESQHPPPSTRTVTAARRSPSR